MDRLQNMAFFLCLVDFRNYPKQEGLSEISAIPDSIKLGTTLGRCLSWFEVNTKGARVTL